MNVKKAIKKLKCDELCFISVKGNAKKIADEEMADKSCPPCE